ncbi:MAG: hypothetical protein AB9M53_00360 [Leptothrix sp. (in: b-proteobacteria)]
MTTPARTQAVRAYLLARLSEASTWRSLVLIASSCGATIRPEHTEAIIAAGLLIAGLLGAALPDSISQPPKDNP